MIINKIFSFFSSLFSDHKKVIWATVILGLLISVIIIFSSVGYNADAAQIYLPMIHAFSVMDWKRAIILDIPPLYTVIAGMLAMLGINTTTSAIIVSSFFSVLTIFPLYGLLSFFVDKKYAAWGTLFYLIAPTILSFGFMPMFEGSRSFFVILPIFLLFSFDANKKLIKLIFFGLALGLLLLIRGDGIPVVILSGLMLLCFKSNNYKFNFRVMRKVIGYCLLTTIVMSAVVFPRYAQIHKATGYWASDLREVAILKEHQNASPPSNNIIKEEKTGLQPNSLFKADIPTNHIRKNKLLSLSFMEQCLYAFIKGSYGLYFALSLLGFFLLLEARKWEFKHSLLVYFIFLNTLMFLPGGLTYRFFMINILLFMPFTLVAYSQIILWSEKIKLKKFVVVLAFMVAIVQIFNGIGCIYSSRIPYWTQAGTLLNSMKIKSYNKQGPTACILGKDLGLNIFNHFNTLFPNIKDDGNKLAIKNILNGVSANNCRSTIRKIPGKEILKPNILIVDVKSYPKYALLLRKMNNLKEVSTKLSKDILIFKVGYNS